MIKWEPMYYVPMSEPLHVDQDGAELYQVVLLDGQRTQLSIDYKGVTHCIDLPDTIRLCQAIKVPQVWLDAPTGPGWWARRRTYAGQTGASIEDDVFFVEDEFGKLLIRSDYGDWEPNDDVASGVICKWLQLHIDWPKEGDSDHTD